MVSYDIPLSQVPLIAAEFNIDCSHVVFIYIIFSVKKFPLDVWEKDYDILWRGYDMPSLNCWCWFYDVLTTLFCEMLHP